MAENPSQQPWYTKRKNDNAKLYQQGASIGDSLFTKSMTAKRCLRLWLPFVLCFLLPLGLCIFLYLLVLPFLTLMAKITFIVVSVVVMVIFLISMCSQIGAVCRFLTTKNQGISDITLGCHYLNGRVEKEEPRKGIPAPELVLQQFIQQVKSYAIEKSFLKQHGDRDRGPLVGGDESYEILRRRWHDVVDSLNEFEIYLASDHRGMIEKLLSQSSLQSKDVAQIFREVAETFDVTWRRRGIHIEHAIVTPLRALTSDALLRRLLVGPWRTCVYFAKRGNSVIFSAKSSQNKIVARWECDGIAFPDTFLELMQNRELSVNERIEQGLVALNQDNHSSPNSLFALISFITWIDLASDSKSDYSIEQGSAGLIIQLCL